MRFHLPSFLLGYAGGLATGRISHHLRPLLVELAALGYRVLDALVVGAARRREDLEDLLAEARARVRGARGGERRPVASA